MAHQSVWYSTFIDESILEALFKQIDAEDHSQFSEAQVGVGEDQSVDFKARNSSISWLDTVHWIGPLIWYYVQRANRENFMFDIDHIDNESMQFTKYGPGQFYKWHRDDSLAVKMTKPIASSVPSAEGNLRLTDYCRKLSFSLILSDPSEYEGGQFQMMSYDNHLYEVPQIGRAHV